MGEEVTKLALECLKTELERLRMKEEADLLMMMAIRDLSPLIPKIIATLLGSEGEISTETFKELRKIMPGFSLKLSVSDFLKFAKTISDDALESLISDLQKMLEDREEK